MPINIDFLASPNSKLPKLPSKLTFSDASQLQKAVGQNLGKKVQSNILKVLLDQTQILLAEALFALKDQKCFRVVSQISFQALQSSPLWIQARFRICGIIIDSFDHYKIDMVKNLIMEMSNPTYDMCQPWNKNRLEIVKAGFESLKFHYDKAASAYYNASKEEILANDEQEQINLIQKTILMCLLSEKRNQTHQLICQIYTNPHAKKSPCYPLITKLYSETMIDSSDIDSIRHILPPKLEKKDPDNISILNKVIFKHNMLPIMKSFQTISLETLSQLLNIDQIDLLVMIEKSFASREVQIDQISNYLQVKADPLQNQVFIKHLFDQMEDFIATTDV